MDGVCAGVIGLSDTLRPASTEMVAELEEVVSQTVLLTGDNRRTAGYFAHQAGIALV